jgi:Mn-dependent DtxR family transcriptional regulator
MNTAGSLVDVMQHFKESGGVFSTAQVAEKLGKDATVVSGMLETLVSMGRLRLVEERGCELCPLRSACSPPDASLKCYCLA